jgi:large subunit ribosomal protein L16
MLSPKRTKFRKFHKIHKKGQVSNLQGLEFGKFGIQALEQGHLDAKTIEAVRRVLTRQFKRTGQVWIRVFPDLGITAKPAEIRMGKGKGPHSHWTCAIQPGQILYEMDGVSRTLAAEAARIAHHKLPIRTRFVIND